MIFKLDDSIIDFIEENKGKFTIESKEIMALNNLARAQMEGHHQIIGSYGVFKCLVNLTVLEQTSRSIYANLFAKCAYYLSLENFCTDYVLVEPNPENLIIRESKDNKTIFRASLSYFDKMEKVSPTVFISEDIRDCEFYEKMAKNI